MEGAAGGLRIANKVGMFTRSAAVAAALLAAACGVPETDVAVDEDFESEAYALSVSSADAAQLLAWVNHPSTTGALLDDQVALDARAAAAVIAHRDGADQALGTADDDLYGSVTELDRVAYVGETALKRMLAWARAHPVGSPENVEGVSFSPEQVSAVVWGVNQTTNDELNDGLGLDNRAVNALLAGRPFASVTQMGAAAYVGPAALTALKAHAPVWAAKRAGPGTLAGTFDGVDFDEATAKQGLKLANNATLQSLLDAGLPIAGAAPMVGNRPYLNLAQVALVSGVGPATMGKLHEAAKANVVVVPSVGDGGTCDTAALLCKSGLQCSGLTLGPTGTCRPSWMANKFRSGTMAVIPDRNAQGVSIGVTVGGLATVAEDVIVHLEIDHPNKAELKILLTQPSSAVSTVWAVNSNGDARVVMGGDVERDSQVNGVWTLTVIDTAELNIGTLNGWTLELTSRMD